MVLVLLLLLLLLLPVPLREEEALAPLPPEGARRAPLALLQREHLAPAALRVTSRQAHDIALPGPAEFDRAAAMRVIPPLIKAYLRIGGKVGQGVFSDAAFNTTDVCMILDIATAHAAQRARYGARI